MVCGLRAVAEDLGLQLGGWEGELEGGVEVVLLLLTAVHHLPLSHHQEPGVPDVGGVELEVGVGQHHEAGGAAPDDLLLVLLHLTEPLNIYKYT